MNVLILSDLFPTPVEPYSGIFVLEQLKALRELGINMVPICPTPWGPKILDFLPRVAQCRAVPREANISDFWVRYPRVVAPGGRFFPIYGHLFYLSLRRLVRQILRDTRIDLIHAHTVMPEGFAAALLARDLNIPLVVTMHGSDVRDYPRDSRAIAVATRWALRQVRHHIAVSREIAEQARVLEPQTRDIHVIHNGADDSHFRPRDKFESRLRLGIPEDMKVLLWVGSLLPIKAVDVLLKAFALLPPERRNDTLLYLVGRGQERTSLEKLAASLGIAESVRFMGVQPYSDIPVWLSASDCLALPSRGEGLPTILPEAMMCRAPVVASAVGGIPEIIIPGRTGLLVQPDDAVGLSSAISSVLEESPQVAEMVDRAEAFANAHLSWRANALNTLQVYTQVIDGKEGSWSDELPTDARDKVSPAA